MKNYSSKSYIINPITQKGAEYGPTYSNQLKPFRAHREKQAGAELGRAQLRLDLDLTRVG